MSNYSNAEECVYANSKRLKKLTDDILQVVNLSTPRIDTDYNLVDPEQAQKDAKKVGEFIDSLASYRKFLNLNADDAKKYAARLNDDYRHERRSRYIDMINQLNKLRKLNGELDGYIMALKRCDEIEYNLKNLSRNDGDIKIKFLLGKIEDDYSRFKRACRCILDLI